MLFSAYSMSLSEIIQSFAEGMKQNRLAGIYRWFSGIVSVWYSRKENILVYPTGLLNTIIYIYLSYRGGLLGEATVNLYYTIMSVYGWYLWSRKRQGRDHVYCTSYSSAKEWMQELAFSGLLCADIPGPILVKKDFAQEPFPRRMHLPVPRHSPVCGSWPARKLKAGTGGSPPTWHRSLYFVKMYVFTSVYYVILLLMACWGW